MKKKIHERVDFSKKNQKTTVVAVSPTSQNQSRHIWVWLAILGKCVCMKVDPRSPKEGDDCVIVRGECTNRHNPGCNFS